MGKYSAADVRVYTLMDGTNLIGVQQTYDGDVFKVLYLHRIEFGPRAKEGEPQKVNITPVGFQDPKQTAFLRKHWVLYSAQPYHNINAAFHEVLSRASFFMDED